MIDQMFSHRAIPTEPDGSSDESGAGAESPEDDPGIPGIVGIFGALGGFGAFGILGMFWDMFFAAPSSLVRPPKLMAHLRHASA